MNALAYDETKDAIEAPFIDLMCLAGEGDGDRSAANMEFSRLTTSSFPNLDYDGACDMAPRATREPSVAPAEKGLAAGVLKQAVRDVRRFRDTTTPVERELYLDAYSWIVANDFSWPFSFLNVCKSLGLVPEVVRDGLLGNSSPGWFCYCRKIGGRVTRALQSSFVSGLTGRPTLEQPKSKWSIPNSL